MSNDNNTRNLIAACAAISVFGLSFGMTYPLLSLILEGRGVSTGMIGVNAAMMPIGILLFAPVIPIASRRFGSRQVAVAAALVTALLIVSYKVFDSLDAWFVIRLLQGMTISTLFVLSEAWIIGAAGDGNRGRIVAIYSSLLSASFGAGPAMVGWIGIDGWAPFVIGAVVIAIGVVPLTQVRPPESPETRQSSDGFMQFLPKAPMLLMAVGAFGILDAATLSLLPVYGVQNGLSVSAAAMALTCLIIGNVVLQFPIGWLADKFPDRLVLAGCAAISAVGLFVLPLIMTTFWMWPTLILIGATGYGVYTVSLISLGNRFSGDELISGSAAFALMWGFGALLGSVSGGWSMAAFGSHGLPVHLAVIYLLLVLGLILRGWMLSRNNEL